MSYQTRDRSLFGRMIRAVRLEPDLYEEVERDRSATGQAATVVLIVGIAGAIAALLSANWLGVIFQIPLAFVGWIIWSYLTYWVGKTIFATPNTRVSPREMLNTLGFAITPQILGVFAFLGPLGGLISLVGFIWAIVAGVVAVRQAMDFDTGRAVGTVIVSGIVYLIISVIIGAILFF
jgi:hypothetical protein